MDLTRRGFISALVSFAAITAVSIPVIEKVVEEITSPETDDYFTDPGLWNIWILENDQWVLIRGKDNRPLEFSSRGDVEAYQSENNLIAYPPDGKNHSNDKNGLTTIQPAPTELHNKDYYNRSATDAESLAASWGLDGYHRKLAVSLLTAKDGGVQSQIWIKALETNKSQVVGLQSNKDFCALIRRCYCCCSYQSTLAKLFVFRPAKVA